MYCEYTCLAFGLSTTPWVFSKVMRELVMYWRNYGIRVLPYLDELFFPNLGFEVDLGAWYFIVPTDRWEAL